jgi:hypothetical protein
MVHGRSNKLRRSLAGLNEPQPTIPEQIEMRERVKARVVHLGRYRRVEVERAARLLRLHFVNRRTNSPMRGTLHWLMLVGQYADTERAYPDDGDYTTLEIWAFVDHEAYKGMNRYWGIARRAVERELYGPEPLILSVFTIEEPERFRAAGNIFLTDRYDQGIILYDRAMDCPRDAEGQAVYDRIRTMAAALPEPAREAFRLYRKYGLDFHHIAFSLEIDEAEAEMHLSVAFGALLAALGKDALPRSLRPRPDPHPRHNLDLYHRPQDCDRLLAVTFYRRALDWAQTADCDGTPPSIVVNGAAYAAEFALKSLLLRAGYADDWNRRHIGLNLNRALAHAIGCGLPQLPGVIRLLAPLSRYHTDGRTPALVRKVLVIMQPVEIAATIRGLIDAVGAVTGYHGLPVEDEA